MVTDQLAICVACSGRGCTSCADSGLEGGPRARAWLRRRLNGLATLLELLRPERAVNDFYRASGNVRCDLCDEEYRRHAEDPRNSLLHMLCNGERVKL
jgi:hypothetical protein